MMVAYSIVYICGLVLWASFVRFAVDDIPYRIVFYFSFCPIWHVLSKIIATAYNKAGKEK
jgi:hypothetical protein